MKKYALWFLALALTGCVGDKPDIQIADTSCIWVKPIYVNKDDKLTERTATEILAHDDKWKKFCGKSK